MKPDTSTPLNLDFDKVLASLPQTVRETRLAAVSQTRLDRFAQRMAELGYVHSRESLCALSRYLAGFGLLLLGNCGTGKTMFFRTINKIRRRQKQSPLLVYKMIDTVGRRIDCIREGLIADSSEEIVLDDIGGEPTFNEFGNRWDILPWLIEMRLSATGRTHFTTNLSPKELESRYGARTVDRLHEMAVTFTFGGQSKRQPTPNARAVREYEQLAAQAGQN